MPPYRTTFPDAAWYAMAALPLGGGLGAATAWGTDRSVVAISSLHPPSIRPASPVGLGSFGQSSTT